MKLFSCPTATVAEFGEFARRAAGLGGTHVVVSDLPKSRWQWEMDLNDPYPNWGMMQATIFKVVIPEELAEWLPGEYGMRNLEIVAERGEVLRSLGLKAAFWGSEPAWWPEAVYAAHPDWRGARCEHPKRARRTYFSPCIDHPEVLGMYRRAVAELCRAAPMEFFQFLTNDSGGGICWSEGLYPGANGPSACRERPFRERLVGFFDTIQQGARDAGLEATVGVFGSIPQSEVEGTWPSLHEKQAVAGKDRQGRTSLMAVGSKDDFYGSCVYPARGIPQVVTMAEELERSVAGAKGGAGADVQYSFASMETTEAFDLVELFNQRPARGLVARMELLVRVAARQVGAAHAAGLVEAWERIQRAVAAVRPIEGGGPVLLLGCVNQRWLTRPFVLFPMELEAQQKDYYRRFQFQTNTQEEAADLMNLQAYELIRGQACTRLATTLFETAIGELRKAIELVEGIAQESAEGTGMGKMRRLGLRLRALICLIRNAEHAAQFQDVMDRTDFGQQPKPTAQWRLAGDPRLREIQQITRAEVDNCHELIGILAAAPGDVLEMAESAEGEDVFMLGPDLVELLGKKAGIMMAHWMDANRVYERFS